MAVSENLSAKKKSNSKHANAEKTNQPIEIDNPLSEREMDVARVLATGASNTEIARTLTISPHTVKVHVRNIYEKLQVNSRTEASMMLVQRGWLAVPGAEDETDAAQKESDAPLSPTPQDVGSVDTGTTDAGTPSFAGADTQAPSVLPTETVQPHYIPSPEPEPEPAQLFTQESQPAMWQRIYLILGLAATVLSFFTPTLFSDSLHTPDLLTDRGSRGIRQLPIPDTPRWMSRTPLREPRSRMATVKVDSEAEGKVYVIGGEIEGGESTGRVEIYDLAVNEWSITLPLPEPRANAAAAVLNNTIYVAGGNYFPDPEYDEPEISDTLWRLEVDKSDGSPAGQWAQAGTLPSKLTGGALVRAGDALYLIGGWDGTKMLNEIWRLIPPQSADAMMPAWDLVNRMELPRAFFGAVTFDEKIYIVGGHDGQKELARADIYDPVQGTWSLLPPLRVPRAGLRLTTNNNSIFALGGGWDAPVNTHERFDQNTKIWSNFQSLLPGEWRHMASFSHNNNLYLIGGWSGDYLDIHVQYENLYQSIHLPIIQSN